MPRSMDLLRAYTRKQVDLRKAKCPSCGKEYWTNRDTDYCLDCEKKLVGITVLQAAHSAERRKRSISYVQTVITFAKNADSIPRRDLSKKFAFQV